MQYPTYLVLMREPRDNPTKSILLTIYVNGTHLRICLDSKDDVAFGTHTDVEIIMVYHGARYGVCLAVRCCGLLVGKVGGRFRGYGYGQVPTYGSARRIVPLQCCPVALSSRYRGTGVISLGDSGEGFEERSIPGLRGALLPRDWCLISYQTS